MENIEEIPMPKNGYFEKMEEMENYFKIYKQSNDLDQGFPVIFEHNDKQAKGAFLFFVKPDIQMNTVFPQMLRIALIHHKENDKKFSEKASVRIVEKKQKKAINTEDPLYREPIYKLYEEEKDQRGFMHYFYQFSYEKETFFQSDQFYMIPMLILAIPAAPFLITHQIYLWTSKKMRIHAHQFRYKRIHTLEQRKDKNKALVQKNPGKIHLVLERHKLSKLPILLQANFLVDPSYKFNHIHNLLRKKIQKANKELEKSAIFFVVGGKVLDLNISMRNIFEKYKEQDNILYMTYQEQERF